MRAKRMMVVVGAAAGLAVIGVGAGAVWDGASGPFALPPEMPADQIPADVLALIGEPGEPLDAVIERIEAAFRAHMESRWIEGEGDREAHRKRFLEVGERAEASTREVLELWIDRGVDFYGISASSLWGADFSERDPGSMDDVNNWTNERKMTREWLGLARESGLLDDILDIERYRLAVRKVIDPERPLGDSGWLDFGQSMRACARVLGAEAVDRFERGDSAGGIEIIETVFAIAEIGASQGVVIENLNALSVQRTGTSVLLTAADRGKIDADHAASMLSRIRTPDWEAMRSDHAYWFYDMLYIVGPNSLSQYYRADGRLRVPIAMKSLLMDEDYYLFRFPALRERGLRHANAGELVSAMEHWIAAALDEFAEPTRERDLSRIEFPRRVNGAVLPVAPETSQNYFGALDLGEREFGAAELALAIEVYRGEHGRVPERLEDLTPGVLERLPEDPFAPDGRFRYRPDGESRVGYILYSVGDDGEDHGGVRSEPDEYGSTIPTRPGSDYVILPRR